MQKKSQQQVPSSLTLDEVKTKMREFVDERQWHKFHTPRNLVLALVGEVGEVAEIFQWKGEVTEGLPEMSQKQREHVGDELADVLSYLVRVADVSGVDLNEAFRKKMNKNRMKYPKDLVKGSSKKYTEYKENHGKQQEQK